LNRAIQEFAKVAFADVPQAVFPIYEMVAGVKIPITFDDRNIAAGWSEYANSWLQAEGGPRCLLEYFHFNSAYVSPFPFIENRTEKTSVFLGRHAVRTDGYRRLRLFYHQREQAEMFSTNSFEKPI
jgi:hypothetical protein